MRLLVLTCLAALLLSLGCSMQKPDPQQASLDRTPSIYPDYSEIVVPPNIAPLNFVVQEKAKAYFAEISSANGRAIKLNSSSGKIQIPLNKWRQLLQKNPGEKLNIKVSIRHEDGSWSTFKPIVNHIAPHAIEPILVYRLIKPLYVYWDQMGIYQRDLTSFKERPVFLNRVTSDNCINCHSFHNHNPQRFLFHMRAGDVGTAMMLAYDKKAYRIDTSTLFNRATAYRAWHPNGKIVAFSANTVNQFFHTVGENRDVYDKASDVVLYNLSTNTIIACPDISTTERMETYPEWSPDGKYLYYCVTDGLDAYDTSTEHPYSKIKYDLMRISYDAANDVWGDVERVLFASEFGQSITHPKVSPDGKYVLFSMSGYGNFSIYKQDADLYLLDTRTKAFHRLDILNSDKSESYHAWSQDGRWVVFSSKREDGLCARPYFSYVDENGEFSKPFVLPQKNPTFYRTFLKTYNIPEFVNGPIKIRPQELAKRAWDKDNTIKAKLDPRLGERQEQAEDPMWKPVEKGKNKI